MSRRAGLLAALAGLTLAFLAVAANVPAAAHAQLLETDPADGSVLPASPDELTLTFSEPVRLVEDSVRVLDPGGSDVDAVSRVVDEQVIVELPGEVGDGTYLVSWRVVSADSHPITGAFTFSVGAPSENTAETATGEDQGGGVTVAAVVTQTAGYVGLLTAAGLVTFQAVLLPGALRASAGARRLRGLALGGAVMAGIALLFTLPLTSAQQTGDDLRAVADPKAWTDQLSADAGLAAWLAIAGLTVGLLLTRRRQLGPVRAGMALAAAGLAVGALALVGHSRTFGPGWLVVSSDVLHVACAAVWLGGLIGLWVILRDADVEPVAASVVVARFSATAAFLVFGLAVAGVFLGWRIVGSWSALFGTAYGVTLLVKVALATAVVAVAAYNRYRLLPQMARVPSWAGLRRTVSAEAGVIMVILALTGFLVEQNPREDDSAGPPGPVAVQADIGDGRVDLRLTPGTQGDNTLEFNLTDEAGDPLTPHHPPTVRITHPAAELGPFEHEVTETGSGSYEASVNVPRSGEWVVEVAVRVSEFEEPIARLPVEVR